MRFADIANADLNADETMTIKMPDAPVRPDWYDAEVLLHTERCGSVAVPLSFTVSYPTTGVMVQKWNDVLALLNREHNCGGFEYEAYQWYRNGEKIDGATASYLYIGGEGERFEPGDEYTVLLTRVGDTAGIMTCPFVPEKRVDKSAPVVLRQPQGARAVFLQPTPQESGVARWYAPSGVLVKECAVDGAVGAIALPDAPGVYVLNVAIEGEVYNFKVINQ